MEEKYYVIKIVKNTQGQYAPIEGSIHDTKESAMVKYHSLMATYMNASDVALAEVIVKNSAGGTYIDDVFVRETADAE